jgi:hypothetical protein
MDFLAHGLWGGAVFGQRRKHSWKWAFFLGMAPDLLAFGPAIIAGIIMGDFISWANWPRDGIPTSPINVYSFYAYHVTHSLIVWVAIAFGLWRWQKRFPWPYAASALHILCDIPLHSVRYFPTPYLWPLPTPLHNGIPWANGRFMLVNYSLIFLTYLVFTVQNYRRRRSDRDA